MADNARGIHVSPGIYTREIDMTYAVRSLGITTLGLAGETLKGPAFQPMDISNWREFQDVFGGTSTEKFKGSQYPKYELPYIAKSYLTESEQLKVVRVLGLSGYNAGPAWIVTASKGSGSTAQAVVVLRSRGTYKPYLAGSSATCVCEQSKYDTLRYYVGEKSASATSACTKDGYNLKALKIEPYKPLTDSGDECSGYTLSSDTGSYAISQTNRGRFKIIGIEGPSNSAATSAATGHNFEYAVSLNPNDKDYILKVLGTKAYDGDAPIYVESLYDIALEQGIANGDLTQIDGGETVSASTSGDVASNGLKAFQVYYTADYCHLEPVHGFVTLPQSALNRKWVGRRLLAGNDVDDAGNVFVCTPYVYGINEPMSVSAATANSITVKNVMPSSITKEEDKKKWSATTVAEVAMTPGQIYTVRQWTSQDGKRYYFYAYYTEKSIKDYFHIGETPTEDQKEKLLVYKDKLVYNSGTTASGDGLVYNMGDNLYYRMADKVEENNNQSGVTYVKLDMNDYKSAYRYASTPWIVSNLKGDMEHIEINKLFRFHTISDGDNSNYEVKVSIENIRPDDGVFDVVVRRIDDLDESIIPLEKFGRCSMIPGTSNYIAYKIGSFDGVYESKSKYITVEVNETTAAKNSVPAGFLGYPIPQYSGTPISGKEHAVAFPTIKYNRYFDEDIKNRKQYFGLSSWVGVDIDNFMFKGTKAYIEDPKFLSHGFHLDSRLDETHNGLKSSAYTVDGASGYVFDCVSTNSRTSLLSEPPIIDKEENMYGSIYEYVNLRKFTVFFYGGFDGWDVYRDQRTNTDNFKMSQYRGYINTYSGEGYAFNRIQNPELLGLNQNGITSDWYAYLSAIRQFANPEATDINVFATPGIDYVNNKLLVEETIEMIEEERADSIYVVTTPDKPSGAGDYVDEMYTPEDAVYNLEDTEIDSNYTCTYYPWVKYLDVDNSQYIYLPPTKDAVRNFAQTDNTAWPWFAPAGIGRGNVDCVRAHFITKLADEDVLYDGRINPIKTFAQDGPKIWGQKNLQINESQLNRIAVRRLLLRLRKLIAISCIGLIFEPNDATTKQSFISTVTPILDSIRANRGISDYRIEVNDTIESRERRELPAKIYFKPYNALEYITIDFILTPEGVSFDDI